MQTAKPLRLIESWAEVKRLFEDQIKAKAVPGRALQILEAGCGRRWGLKLDGVAYELTGVDLDAVAMEHRKNVQKDLDHAIIGDLRTVELPAGVFDVIYCSFVLEHIAGAEDVMRRFVTWLAPGGIIIVLIPDPQCVRGFVTRITPHWVHVFLYRHILRMPHAGEPGYMPYRVYYDPVVSRAGMREFCARNGLAVVGEYGDGFSRLGKGIVGGVLSGIMKFVSLVSFGALSARHANLIYILSKPSANDGSVASGERRAFSEQA